jgi:GTP-binding protein Era
MTLKCGYIAILGRPNAGKSTLLNSLVGEKLAVVSRKPQTTRNRILGIAVEGETQLLFLDTPGIHKKHGEKSLINTTMNKVAIQVAHDADVILYLIDAEAGITDEDKDHITQIISTTSVPVAVLISKTDSVKYENIPPVVKELEFEIGEIFKATGADEDRLLPIHNKTISSKRPDEVKTLRRLIAKELPESPWMFADDDLTDMPGSFLCAEMIREQIFRQCGQEVPYSCAVKIEQIDTGGPTVRIFASIVVNSERHKPMILGKGGLKIRGIGTDARLSLEKYFEKKVFLDLRVKTVSGWVDDERLISELAHLQNLEGLADLTAPN